MRRSRNPRTTSRVSHPSSMLLEADFERHARLFHELLDIRYGTGKRTWIFVLIVAFCPPVAVFYGGLRASSSHMEGTAEAFASKLARGLLDIDRFYSFYLAQGTLHTKSLSRHCRQFLLVFDVGHDWVYHKSEAPTEQMPDFMKYEEMSAVWRR